MNPIDWQRFRRTVLVVACAAYFSTLTVIGQVAEGDPAPEVPAHHHAGSSR